MIKVNLLPYREMLQKARVKRQLISAVIILAVLFVGIGIVQATLKGQIKERQKKIAQLKKSISEKEKIKRLIEDFKKRSKELERKTKIVESLANDKALLVHILDEIATRIPQNEVWLTSLEARGSMLTLNGIALTNEIIANFMKQLEESPYLDKKGVELVQSRMITKEGIKLKEFRLECKISAPQIDKSGTSTLKSKKG